MKSILALGASLLVSAIVISTPAFGSERAVNYVRTMGNEAIRLGNSGNLNGFCSLVKRATDTAFLSSYTLGDFASQASPAQLRTIKNLIDDMLANHLFKAFTEAAGGELRVYDRVVTFPNDVNVDAQLFDARGRSRYNFEFRVFNPDSNPVIVDARINRTLVSRYLHNDYTSYMKRRGGNEPVEALIAHLAGENTPCP